MVRIIFVDVAGTGYLPLFLQDTETGITGKDVMTHPGAYDEVCKNSYELKLVEMDATIGTNYQTKMFGLIPSGIDQDQIEDMTATITQLKGMPSTAAQMFLNGQPEELARAAKAAMDTIQVYEDTTRESKVFLPEEAFSFIDEEVAKKMRSSRRMYALDAAENREIFQAAYDQEYGIVLPSLHDIHTGLSGDRSSWPQNVDLLRVALPYRQDIKGSKHNYHAIYHTPYYRIDPSCKGMVLPHLSWLNGSNSNNLLSVQPYERHMYDNMYSLVCSDTATYVSEIVTGIIFRSSFGSNIFKLLNCKQKELMETILQEISATVPDYIQWKISSDELFGENGEVPTYTHIVNCVRKSIFIDADGIAAAITNFAKFSHMVETYYLPFVLLLTDEVKDTAAQLLVENCIVTKEILNFVIYMCCAAYQINWGHTGATESVEILQTNPGIAEFNKGAAAMLDGLYGGGGFDANDKAIVALYPREDNDDDNEESGSEASVSYKHYVSPKTAYLMSQPGGVDSAFLSRPFDETTTTEERIAEYFRENDGDANLQAFLSGAFSTTGDIKILLDAFAKLMRWGINKPSLLVFEEHPAVKNVFDLNNGKEIPNTAVVDENSLIKVNGCQYTLAGVLTAPEMGTGTDDAIVGFMLCRDYGGIKKYFVASWVDIGEMVDKGELDVADLKTMTSVDLDGSFSHSLPKIADMAYGYHLSNKNIDLGLKYNIHPAELSELALLGISGILTSSEYLKHARMDVVLTTKDRQYRILSNYSAVINALYDTYRDKLTAMEITTADINAIAKRAYELFNSAMSKQVLSANESRANSTLNALNFEDSTAINFHSGDLNGKFAFVYDWDMECKLPAMEFSDPKVQGVASKLRNRVVLLVLETGTEIILCRKDIGSGDVLIAEGKISCKKYSNFAKVFDKLKEGGSVHVNIGGVRKEAKLHRSLSEFI